jgi:hypothetical protein
MTTSEGTGNQFTIIGIAVAAAITVVATDGRFDLFDAVVGIVLWLLMTVYGSRTSESEADSATERLAITAVWTVCALLIVGFIIDALLILINLQGITWLGQQLVNLIIVAIAFAMAVKRQMINQRLWA